jgi:hypothetical protein
MDAPIQDNIFMDAPIQDNILSGLPFKITCPTGIRVDHLWLVPGHGEGPMGGRGRAISFGGAYEIPVSMMIKL